MKTRGWVYFIRATDPNGAVKIGFTQGCPSKRLRGLQSSSPLRLALAAAVPGTRETELELHVRFIDDHLHGEWFSPSTDLLAYIEACSLAPNSEPLRWQATPGFLSASKVAKFLSLTPHQLWQWMTNGSGPPHVKIDGHVLWRMEDIKRWADRIAGGLDRLEANVEEDELGRAT